MELISAIPKDVPFFFDNVQISLILPIQECPFQSIGWIRLRKKSFTLA